ncbi:hypothetical protein, partial [Mycolicibacterium setense]
MVGLLLNEDEPPPLALVQRMQFATGFTVDLVDSLAKDDAHSVDRRGLRGRNRDDCHGHALWGVYWVGAIS